MGNKYNIETMDVAFSDAMDKYIENNNYHNKSLVTWLLKNKNVENVPEPCDKAFNKIIKISKKDNVK